MTAQFNIIYYTMALICPTVNLLRSLFVALNVYSLACRGQNYGSYPGEFGLYGGPILCLTLQCLFLVCFLMFWESGRSLEVFGIRLGDKAQLQDFEDDSYEKAVATDAQEG